MDIEDMLGNAATASQHLPLVEDLVLRGAVLRSIYQWMESDESGVIDFLLFQLKRHPDFNS